MGADPVTIGLIMAGAGTAMEIYGQEQAAEQKAEAARINAQHYKDQAELSRISWKREAAIFMDESEAVIGDQVSSFARAGVDMSGSAMKTIASAKGKQQRELAAIETKGRLNVRMSRSQAQQAEQRANFLTSGEAKFMRTAGSLLNFGSRAATMGARDPSPSGNTDFSSQGGSEGPTLLRAENRRGQNA